MSGRNNRNNRDNKKNSYSLEDLAAQFGRPAPPDDTPRTENARGSQPPRKQQAQSASPKSYPMTPGAATAPYNFIPLPKKPVTAPFAAKLSSEACAAEIVEAYRAHIAAPDRLSGSISFEVEAKSPVFINTSNAFFAPNGVPLIPGSTLRGLVKEYLKIISCGTMRPDEDITNRRLYFRDFAGKKSSLKDNYKSRMTKKITIDGGGKIDVADNNPGFLAKKGGEYVIFPATLDREKYNDQLDMENHACMVEWLDDGAILHSGKMKTKEHFYILKNIEWHNPIPVPRDVLAAYEYDQNKKKPIPNVNVLNRKMSGHNQKLALGKGLDHLMPCFYTTQFNNELAREEVATFGGARYYRIPYLKTTIEHIFEMVRDEKRRIVDFSDALFGRLEAWASRVFFDDAVPASKNTVTFLPKAKPHPLLGPNPTSFQLYLEQTSPRSCLHWDDKTPLRGYKLYWHQAATETSWHYNSMIDKGTKDDQREFSPAATGSRWQGRIRFQDLSRVELGAIMASLRLAGGNNAMKLGMGKPIGLGSIQISNIILSVIDEKARYKELFTAEGEDWKSGRDESVNKNGKEYQDEFEAFMKEETTRLGIADDYKKIRDSLNVMLNWNKAQNLGARVNQMELRQFRDREILPTALAIGKETHIPS